MGASVTAVVLQARINSTRLPRKALLDLDGKPVLLRVMETLRHVPADVYVVACDEASCQYFAPLAAAAGFLCISGPAEDVLERFCLVIRKTGADTVVRATGDNPFLFADAASASLERYRSLRDGDNPPDYFTWSGLPHGSGVEIMNGKSILHAAALTDSSFDHEHVGPALYRHRDKFRCMYEQAPEQWFFPGARTTIDTREDYDRACHMMRFLLGRDEPFPFGAESVIDAWRYVSRPIVFVPSTLPGNGTGHLTRTVDLVERMRKEWLVLLYLENPEEAMRRIPEHLHASIVPALPERAHRVVIDNFRTDRELMRRLGRIAPVIALDEGGTGRTAADYLLDIIPGLYPEKSVANRTEPRFIPLPVNRKHDRPGSIKTVLVVAGGENAAKLAHPAGRIMALLDYEVTVIDPDVKGISVAPEGYTISGPVQSLRERLCHYDLVITHYGFTAYEALAAGCEVMLFSPTRYHYWLAIRHGFPVIPPGRLSSLMVTRLLESRRGSSAILDRDSASLDLAAEIASLCEVATEGCPLCGIRGAGKIIARHQQRTISRCHACGMAHISFLGMKSRSYSRSYFFEEYRNQYGKTYLEDFASIKAQGVSRIARIEAHYEALFAEGSNVARTVLDVGCAYGPFLDAARDAGWVPTGTDISSDAVEYVRSTLGLPAVISAFPAPDADQFLDRERFTALTLWYVIEHFVDLETVFSRIRALLIPGGILAFSTPSERGISAISRPADFWKRSPDDHWTIWNPGKTRKQLAARGFTVLSIVSTGHHPERFPLMADAKRGGLAWRACLWISRAFSLGDTFEVYATKNGTLVEDAE